MLRSVTRAINSCESSAIAGEQLIADFSCYALLHDDGWRDGAGAVTEIVNCACAVYQTVRRTTLSRGAVPIP
ncbi:hypothetical protein J6590_051397 [Homalodisca vitripennis]|nr:hypothetical protein J6590_051397 [Homalodisca vitripennis]